MPKPYTRAQIRIGNLKKIIGNIPKVNKYLDVGCNNGKLTKEIAELINPGAVYGCDVAEDLVKGINYFSSTKFDKQDIKFDFITCFMVFHHLGDNFDYVLSNIIRCLAQNGILFIKEHDATGLSKHDLDEMHKNPDFENEHTGDLGITKYFTFDELNSKIKLTLLGTTFEKGKFKPYYAVYKNSILKE